jgi:IMP dehydrogenase/GMP reductase
VREGVELRTRPSACCISRRIEKLLVVDDHFRCVGLITVKDIEKSQLTHPQRLQGRRQGRLRAAAATTLSAMKGFERAERLIDAGVRSSSWSIRPTAIPSACWTRSARAKKLSNSVPHRGRQCRHASRRPGAHRCNGADAVKVGIGPGSICTTRVVAGVGVPQLAAIMDAVEESPIRQDVPVIADGGIKFSGDLAKALAAGASAGHDRLAAGRHRREPRRDLSATRAAPTRPIAAWAPWAPWRAVRPTATSRQDSASDTLKLVPEGIEGQVPYKGPAGSVLHQLAGGLRAAMGYVGAVATSRSSAAPRHLRAHHLVPACGKAIVARRDHHPREPQLPDPDLIGMALVYPVLAQILLTFIILGAMGRARVRAVTSGRVKMGEIAANGGAFPDDVRRFGNNFSNQFETPVLFYVLVGIAIFIRATDVLMVLLAWAFVATRVAHAYVHLTSNHVPTRFRIFGIGVFVLLATWVLIVIRLLTA